MTAPLPLFELGPAVPPEHPTMYDRNGTRWTWRAEHGGYFSERFRGHASASSAYPLDALERDMGPLSTSPTRRTPCPFCGGRR